MDICTDPVAADAGSSAACPAGTGAWFEAATSFGPIRLNVRGERGAPRHAADAALALHRCDALLDALDDWSGLDLAWRWTGTPNAGAGTGMQVCATWRIAAPVPDLAPQCSITWPWALLRARPAPADALARRLQWAAVPVVLSAARLRLDADELDRLEPGGAIVLPASMQPPWQGLLRALDEPADGNAGVPVALPSPWQPQLVRTLTRDAWSAGTNLHTAAEPLHEVRLTTARAVAADRLTGWFEDALGELCAHASLWRCASPDEAAACLAIGRLMPWGDGWALALENVWEHARRAAPKKV